MGVLSLSIVSPLPAAHAARPNVIVVMTDDQGYGDLSVHGNPVLRTPNLDRLASQSIRLTDFHGGPMCTPTRGQLMSGRHALANGAMNVRSGRAILRKTIPTMANFFAGAGYRTSLFGKWHLGDNHPYRPQDRGFQETLTFQSSYLSAPPNYWNNDYFDDFYLYNGQLRQYPGYSTDVFFAEARRWIKRRAALGEPFFAYITPNTLRVSLYRPKRTLFFERVLHTPAVGDRRWRSERGVTGRPALVEHRAIASRKIEALESLHDVPGQASIGEFEHRYAAIGRNRAAADRRLSVTHLDPSNEQRAHRLTPGRLRLAIDRHHKVDNASRADADVLGTEGQAPLFRAFILRRQIKGAAEFENGHTAARCCSRMSDVS